MNNNLIKILISSFLILQVLPVDTEAAGEGSITITVTIKEVISEVIVISPDNQSGDPEDTLAYTFIVKNNGNSPDSYLLEATSSNDWETGLPGGDTIGPLNPGQQEEAEVRLTIPRKGLANIKDTLTLTATSLSDSSVSASDSVTTTVNQVTSVFIRLFPRDSRARPGETVSLRATIRNRGNGDDYFQLVASSLSGWKVELPQGDTVGPIKPKRRKIIPVRVEVPLDARRGKRDRVTITATSQFDPSVSDSSFSIITVR